MQPAYHVLILRAVLRVPGEPTETLAAISAYKWSLNKLRAIPL